MKIKNFVRWTEETLEFIYSYWCESVGLEDATHLDFGKYQIIKKK